MATLAAVIFTDAPDGVRRVDADLGRVVVAGLSLTERAALAAHRAGIDRVHFVGRAIPESAELERLRARGLHVTAARRWGWLLTDAPAADLLVVMPADTIVEPAALISLIERSELRPGEAALMLDSGPEAANRLVKVTNGRVISLLADGDAASTDIAILSPDAVFLARDAFSARQAFRRLARYGVLKAFDATPHFYERLRTPDDVARIERAYLSRLNSGEGESFLTNSVLILAGITLATLRANGYGAPTGAAEIALVAGVLVFFHHGYFRDRVARENPGRFDDAVTATFAGRGRVSSRLDSRSVCCAA